MGRKNNSVIYINIYIMARIGNYKKNLSVW